MPVSKEIKRSVYFISDGTAITAETLGHSLLAQFPNVCLLYTSPSPRDRTRSRMPSSA